MSSFLERLFLKRKQKRELDIVNRRFGNNSNEGDVSKWCEKAYQYALEVQEDLGVFAYKGYLATMSQDEGDYSIYADTYMGYLKVGTLGINPVITTKLDYKNFKKGIYHNTLVMLNNTSSPGYCMHLVGRHGVHYMPGGATAGYRISKQGYGISIYSESYYTYLVESQMKGQDAVLITRLSYKDRVDPLMGIRINNTVTGWSVV